MSKEEVQLAWKKHNLSTNVEMLDPTKHQCNKYRESQLGQNYKAYPQNQLRSQMYPYSVPHKPSRVNLKNMAGIVYSSKDIVG